MKPKSPETPDNGVEYIVIEDDTDMESDSEKEEDSSSSESDDEDEPLSKQTAQSAITTNEENRVCNGKLHVGQPSAGSLSSFAKTSPSSFSTSRRRPSRLLVASSASPVRLEKDEALGEPTNQPPACLSAPAETAPAAATSDPDSPPAPTIMAVFENDSQYVALMKRMKTGWRSKVPYSCRQCGAVLRQPSFIISHRYLHRGYRSHRCQCGRAFRHRLHLLRHCVEHAEAMSYICVLFSNFVHNTL
ncbi:unnamed protein product [Pleuronectes platessa]|uniref:C2H2-type domain-containing protein n=1 Tax=Pleuronectes platessa TaxID=8262 RepID=A0A9N7UB60_PLEPL|nr:unnamed protein product [Pleuronectes platessa]